MNRLLWLLVAITVSSCGQPNQDGFVARSHQTPSGQMMEYRLFIPPKYDKSHRYPLVLWLHGTNGSGLDNLSQIRGDQTPGTHLWTTAENQAKHPAFVVAPQTNRRGWDNTGMRRQNPDKDLQITTELEEVIAIVESLEAEFSLDSGRLYVAGQSMGGFGTWNLITKKPGVFAAAIILCGGGNPDLAKNARDLPVWSFQGDSDRSDILESNRRMIAAIRQAGGNPRYTEYPGMGHEIWDRVFKEPGLVEWLFAQHK